MLISEQFFLNNTQILKYGLNVYLSYLVPLDQWNCP